MECPIEFTNIEIKAHCGKCGREIDPDCTLTVVETRYPRARVREKVKPEYCPYCAAIFTGIKIPKFEVEIIEGAKEYE